MLKKFSKRMSALIITLTLTLMSIPLATHAASDDIITIIHTNDMHGRLGEKINVDGDTFAYTKLAGIKHYAEEIEADLILDAGDAIQGLPISNISDGKYMIEALREIGYTAMTVGNHEFDFGQENLFKLKEDYTDDNFHILSNNTYDTEKKDYPFERFVIVEEKGVDIGIIGVTTPETSTKSHPKNTTGLEFKDPFTEIEKDIEALMDEDVELIIVNAHLGRDGTTVNEERGDILADKLAHLDLETPILFIDGHSHTEIPQGEQIGENVFYVQTGEYLNNLGHVEVNLADFSKTSAKLVDIETLNIKAGSKLILDAEIAALADYEAIAGEIILESFPFDMISDGKYARSQEIALGNMIADAMMEYGKDFEQQPDLAVINGGGIRADLNQGKVTKGDIISILPFGNMYSSIEVSGKELIEMFEYSIRAELLVDDDGFYIQNADGTYLLDRNGGFLQISGASLEYNPFNKPGERVKHLMIGDKPVDLDKTYILATNDFLAEGGDGYTMLGGKRVEGEGLEQILIDFLQNTEDFEIYRKQFPLSRIIPDTYSEETVYYLLNLLEEIEKRDLDKYTEESLQPLILALQEANDYFENLGEEGTAYEHEILELIYNLEDALENLEEREIDEKPPTPKPAEPETPAPETPEAEDTTPKDDLPATGSVSLAYPAIILVGLGVLVKVISKRRA